MGGLGLRAATDHASVAHATSLLGAHSLVHDLLGQGARPPISQNEPGGQASNPQGELPLPRLPLPLLQDITAKQGEETLVTVESLFGMSQKMASLKVDKKNQSFLSNLIAESGNLRDIARFSSLGLPHSGSWLSVVPSPPWVSTFARRNSSQF